MRLADDERARVPFALIGVLLLVGSLGVATIQFDDERVDTDVRIAGDRAETTAESALRDAVSDAGASAAAEPVVDPAETDFGALLDDDRPFRSYLELLVALRFRERLSTTEQRVDQTAASVDLRPIEDRATASDALNRTTVAAADTGLVEATVEDAPIVVRRNGEVVDERTETLTVTVATPAITLHDRVTAFEERVDGGITTTGSVSQALTGGLYGLAWARGWGQYLGLPIDDPIANRHTELLTNLALIDAQRATLGGTDPAAKRGLAAATVRVAAEETVGFAEGSFADAALPEPNAGPALGSTAPPQPETTVVGVNQTADRALADVLRSEPRGVPADDLAARSLDALVRDALTVEAKLATRRETQSRVLRDRTGPENASAWERHEGEPSVSVERVDDAAGPAPDGGSDWSAARTETRTVVLEEVVPLVYTNRDTGAVEDGEAVYRRTVEVGIAVAHRPKPVDWIPDRPLQGGAGGAGPGQSGVGVHDELVDEASDELLGSGAEVDRVAGQVATNDLDRDHVTISPEDVQDERDAVYDDLRELREELRTVRTEADRSFVATEEDPAGDLRDRLRDDRADYVDVPRRYADLEQRATVAARVAYVDRVIDRIDTRSAVGSETQSALEESAGEIGSLPQGGLDQLLDVGRDYERPTSRPLNATDPAPDLQLQVSGAPAYLERDAVEVAQDGGRLAESSSAGGGSEQSGTDGGSEQSGAGGGSDSSAAGGSDEPVTVAGAAGNGSYYPLAVKTRTIPSLDTGDMADEIAGRVTDLLYDSDDETVPLPMAARSLQGAERVPADVATAGDTSLGTDRRALRSEVSASVDVLEERSVTVVAARTELTDRRARQVVDTALAPWRGPAERAIAFENESAADAIAATAAERPAVSAREADSLQTVLRDAVARELASESTHVRMDVAERAVDEARALTEDVVANATESGLESAQEKLEDRVGRVPILGLRGAPLVPIPGYWAATANVWHVEVRGGYASFGVSVPQGAPADGGELRYVRDGSTAAVDVTGDGSPERLGSSTQISFEASTTVVVVVPPNGGGVGNAEPDFGETSPGWDAWNEPGGADRAAEST